MTLGGNNNVFIFAARGKRVTRAFEKNFFKMKNKKKKPSKSNFSQESYVVNYSVCLNLKILHASIVSLLETFRFQDEDENEYEI